MFKLLAVDIDGTLVRGDGSVEERDRAAIGALQRNGVAVALVTGRLYGAARPVAEALEIDGPHVCVDGASVHSFPKDDEILHAGIAGEVAEAVRCELGRHRVAVLAVIDDAVMLDGDSALFEQQVRHMSPTVKHVPRVLDDASWRGERGVLSAVAVGPTDVIKSIEQHLRGATNLELARHDMPRVADVSSLLLHAAGVSKGAGVELLARHYGCRLDDVVVIGDWHNDVSMFAVAGRSFAMGGAPNAVREAATDMLHGDVLAGGGVAEAVVLAWPELRWPELGW